MRVNLALGILSVLSMLFLIDGAAAQDKDKLATSDSYVLEPGVGNVGMRPILNQR
jgi:hypothetical protein